MTNKIKEETLEKFNELLYPASIRSWSWRLRTDYLILEDEVLSFGEQANFIEVFSLTGDRKGKIDFENAVSPVDLVQEDNQRHCWIASASASCVYKIDLKTGHTLSVIGEAFSRESSLKCPVAVDYSSGKVFIVDAVMNAICEYDIASDSLSSNLTSDEEILDLVALEGAIKYIETSSGVYELAKNELRKKINYA